MASVLSIISANRLLGSISSSARSSSLAKECGPLELPSPPTHGTCRFRASGSRAGPAPTCTPRRNSWPMKRCTARARRRCPLTSSLWRNISRTARRAQGSPTCASRSLPRCRISTVRTKSSVHAVLRRRAPRVRCAQLRTRR